jgi:hypothetical protein
VAADVRFVERDGFIDAVVMSDVGGRVGAARTFSEVRARPFADLILRPKFRFAPEAVGRQHFYERAELHWCKKLIFGPDSICSE